MSKNSVFAGIYLVCQKKVSVEPIMVDICDQCQTVHCSKCFGIYHTCLCGGKLVLQQHPSGRHRNVTKSFANLSESQVRWLQNDYQLVTSAQLNSSVTIDDQIELLLPYEGMMIDVHKTNAMRQHEIQVFEQYQNDCDALVRLVKYERVDIVYGYVVFDSGV